MQLFINNWTTVLTAPALSGDLSLSVDPGKAAELVGLAGPDHYLLTLSSSVDGIETAWEIVKVTAVSGSVLTVERGQEGTAAAAWGVDAEISARATAGSLVDLRGATTAQGALADTAVQPGDLATVATTGAYADLIGLPALGTAAATASTAYATAAQGAKADTAVQPGALAAVATTGAYASLSGLPTIPTTAAQVGAIASTEKGAASGVATLDAGSKIPLAQLPATAITDTSVVVSQAAMLALTAQTGDVAVRTDISTSFILTAEPSSTLGNWQQLLSPAAGGGAAVGSAVPQALGTATPGVSTSASREDHVHAMPTAANVGAAPAAHVGAGGTEHAGATTTVAGFMTGADKTKLDGVATGATANAGTVTGVTGTAPIVSSGGAAPAISISAATTVAAGSMSAADKTKLDGVAAGATANANTDSLAEGATNLYHTAARVRAVLLTGLSLLTGTAVAATDTVLEAFGKVQKQITDLTATVSGKQATLVSATNIKTINGTTVLGSGDLVVSGGASLAVVTAFAGTAKTLALTDINTIVDCTSASAVTITIAPQASVVWTADAEIHVRMSGAGVVSIAVGTGVTVPPLTAPVALSGQGAVVTLKRRSSDVWAVVGGIAGAAGDVTGPASAVDNQVALFSGTTGKLIKAGGLLGTASASAVGDFAAAAHVGSGGTAHANAVAAGAAGFMTGADKSKLDGVATGATANATDLALRDRATHTGAQATSTITGLDAALGGKQATLVSGTSIKTINGTSVLGSGDIVIAGGGGGSLAVAVVTATTQAAAADTHYVLTNVAATTVTLPASPASGSTVWVTVTNGLTTNVIARNAQTIMGLAEDMTINRGDVTVALRFVNSSWRLV
jgi:hypothetical protein